MSEPQVVLLRPYELRMVLEHVYENKEDLNKKGWDKSTVDNVLCRLACTLGSNKVDKEILEYLDDTPCVLGKKLNY